MLIRYKGQIINGSSGNNTTDGDIPSGCILIWSGTSDDIPGGWALCDGQDGRPDLRDKFVLGAGTEHSVGQTGGSEEVTLTVEQMPKHSHTINTLYGGSTAKEKYVFTGKPTNDGSAPNTTSIVNDSGSSLPHNNMPPYYTLCYIIKL